MKHSSRAHRARGTREVGTSTQRYILVYPICTFLAEPSTAIPTRGEDMPRLSPVASHLGDVVSRPTTGPFAGGTSGISGTQGTGCLLPWSPGVPLHLLPTEQATTRTTQRNGTALVPEHGKHSYHRSSMRPSLEDSGGNWLPTTPACPDARGSWFRCCDMQRSGLQQKRARSLQKISTVPSKSEVPSEQGQTLVKEEL